MASHNTAEEVEQQYLDAMGPALGRLFHALWNDVARVHANWQEYRTLYGTSEDNIGVLNETAAYFFRVIQDALWEGTLLHLCRLTDPATMGKYTNLTLAKLPELMDDSELRLTVSGLVDRAVAATDFARDWRNRHIAHSDLKIAIGGQAAPLKAGSRKLVEEALDAIRATMNCVDIHFRGTQVAYEHFFTDGSDADAVLFHLRRSIELEQRERRQLGLE